MKMKLSVIIPVYNVEKYIKECLNSIINQDVKDVEVICVNDGSTDGSLKIIKQYEQEYEYIHVYSKQNGGLSSARNFGIEKAKGEYLFFLDSDDMLADEECLLFMKEIIEKQDIDILYFDGCSFFEDGLINRNNNNERYANAYQRKKSYGLYQYGKFLFADLVQENDYYCQVSLQCVKKAFLDKYKLFFPIGMLYEDNLFTFKGMLLAGKVRHQKKTVLLRRIRDGSIMQSKPVFHNFYSHFFAYKEMLQFWENNKDIRCVDNEIEIVINSKKNIAKNVYYELDIEEQNNIFTLPQYEQYIVNSFLYSNVELNKDEYSFPYHLFRFGSCIAIYGAGNIGKKFYYSAKRDKLINIVGIFDTNALERSSETLQIFPPYMIKEIKYDYILIAVEKLNVAQEIKEILINEGISPNKIKWDGRVYLKNNLYLKSYEYCKFFNRLMISEKRRLFLMMLPEHGNLGDHAIAIAEERFLKYYFSEYELICITTNEFFALQEVLINFIHSSDIIFFQGGGYIGDLWNNGRNLKKIIKLYPKNIKILFPNSMAYKNNELNICYIKEEVKELYENNLYIFFRDKKSYQYFQKNGYHKKCYYFPDIVLYLSVENENKFQKYEHKKVLLCLRNDEEKIFESENKLKQILNSLRLEYIEQDTHLYKYIPKCEGEDNVNDMLKIMQNSKLVITDRLHGMIFSAICGVPCIAFDNSTHKIFDVYYWLKERKNIILCKETDLKNLPQYIDSVLKIGYCKYEPIIDKFNEMAEIIRKIITV